MSERPVIPHDPTGRPTDEFNRGAKRWIRKLAEAGKLTRPGKRIPILFRVNWRDKPQ